MRKNILTQNLPNSFLRNMNLGEERLFFQFGGPRSSHPVGSYVTDRRSLKRPNLLLSTTLSWSLFNGYYCNRLRVRPIVSALIVPGALTKSVGFTFRKHKMTTGPNDNFTQSDNEKLRNKSLETKQSKNFLNLNSRRILSKDSEMALFERL